jgi:hypothetical protein
MRDAPYLRAQAELCLEMAWQISDRTASENLRAEATRYHAEAAALKTGVKTKVASSKIAPAEVVDVPKGQKPTNRL